MKQLPSHVQKLEDGGLACMHCGGDVDEDGYAYSEDIGDNEPEGDVGEESEQMESTERLVNAGELANALSKRRGA